MLNVVAPAKRLIRVRLPSILPIGPTLLVLVLAIVSLSAAAVALDFMDVTDAYGSLTFLVISIVIAHFIRPGWLEFDRECKTVRMVSVVQRQFEIASWPVTLKTLPIISLSLGSELLICRDGDLEFSIRVRETCGKESLICGLWPLGYREGIKLARSIEKRTGLATRLRAMAVNAADKHEVEWTQQSNRKHFRIMLLAGFAYITVMLGVTLIILRYFRR